MLWDVNLIIFLRRKPTIRDSSSHDFITSFYFANIILKAIALSL